MPDYYVHEDACRGARQRARDMPCASALESDERDAQMRGEVRGG